MAFNTSRVRLFNLVSEWNIWKDQIYRNPTELRTMGLQETMKFLGLLRTGPATRARARARAIHTLGTPVAF